ncbi:hypothetical protein P7L66_13225 [Tistrella mobilis]|uniref:hypothetical protein n=1 Tax=Tistrella mobilis TaxID=171437 RepID=UPI0035574684
MIPALAQELPPELVGMPLQGVLLGYQAKVIKLIDRYPLVGVPKSRRIGLTWGVAARGALVSASQRKAGGMDTLYMGPEKEMAREFIDAVAMWSRAYALVGAQAEVEEYIYKDERPGAETRSIQAFRIAFASGYEVNALAGVPRALRGRQGFVIIDEAAFVDNLPEILKAALALTMQGGRVVFVSTHDGADNEFNQEICRIREGKRAGAVVHEITFEAAVADGLYERLALTNKVDGLTKQEWIDRVIGIYAENADEELHVIPRNGGGAYFRASLLAECRDPDVPVIRWTAPDDILSAERREEHLNAIIDDWILDQMEPLIAALPPTARRSVVGLDFGRTIDATCIWLLVEGGNRWLTPAVIELRNVPFRGQERILAWLGRRLPRLHHMALDATGNGAALAEAMTIEFGPRRVSEIKISTDWYRENMPLCKAALEREALPVPADPDVEADFRAIELVRGVPQVGSRRTKGKDGLPRHGDTVIACALAVYARAQKGGPSGPIGSLEDGDVDHQEERAVISDYVGALSGTLDDYRRM